MNMDFVRWLLIVLTGLAGIIGILYELRDDSKKRPTRAGLVSVVLIVACMALALLADVISARKVAADEKAAREASERLLRRVNQSFNRIDAVQLTIWAQGSLEGSGLDDYVHAARNQLGRVPRYAGISVSKFPAGLVPQSLGGRVAHSAVDFISAELHFFRKGAQPFSFGHNRGDLVFDIVTRSHAELNLEIRKFSMFVNEYSSGLPNNNSGAVTSIEDLAGAKLYVAFTSPSIHSTPNEPDTAVEADLKKLKLVTNTIVPVLIGVRLSDGRVMFLGEKQFSRFDSEGTPVYMFEFPDSEEECLKMFSRTRSP
jgi:hypothetical protein